MAEERTFDQRLLLVARAMSELGDTPRPLGGTVRKQRETSSISKAIAETQSDKLDSHDGRSLERSLRLRSKRPRLGDRVPIERAEISRKTLQREFRDPRKKEKEGASTVSRALGHSDDKKHGRPQTVVVSGAGSAQRPKHQERADTPATTKLRSIDSVDIREDGAGEEPFLRVHLDNKEYDIALAGHRGEDEVLQRLLRSGVVRLGRSEGEHVTISNVSPNGFRDFLQRRSEMQPRATHFAADYSHEPESTMGFLEREYRHLQRGLGHYASDEEDQPSSTVSDTRGEHLQRCDSRRPGTMVLQTTGVPCSPTRRKKRVLVPGSDSTLPADADGIECGGDGGDMDTEPSGESLRDDEENSAEMSTGDDLSGFLVGEETPQSFRRRYGRGDPLDGEPQTPEKPVRRFKNGTINKSEWRDKAKGFLSRIVAASRASSPQDSV